MARQIQLRRGDLSIWLTNDPVLADGELVLVSSADDGIFDQWRIGNGVDAFSVLPVNEYTGVIGDGSPRGVYADLAALASDDPNHMYVYITLDNGFWNYWNGAAWTAGAEYQTPLSVVQVTGDSVIDVMSQKAVTTTLTDTERVLADAIVALEGRVKSLEEFIRNAIFDTLQVETLSVVKDVRFKGASLFLTGTGAPGFAPDFINQFYTDTDAGISYQAKGIANAADWKPTTNA